MCSLCDGTYDEEQAAQRAKEAEERKEGRMEEIHESLGCEDTDDLTYDNSKTIYGMISSLEEKVNSLEKKMDKILSILEK